MKLLKIGTGQNSSSSWLVKFSFLWLFTLNCCKADAVWTAYMNISFRVGNRVLSVVGETGVFGKSSTLKRVTGVLVPPDGKNKNACNPNTSFSTPKNSETWLALIERGGCNFTQKIKVATEKGASGVVIYNFPGSGNQLSPMSHQPFEDTVVVLISNLKGMKLLLWVARNQSRRWQQLATDLKKAFGHLQVRVLKEGDEELNPSGDSCVVCLEPYKPNDTIRILTCKHIFHKNCIDPWILAHGTCPMCKCDILKTLGIQVNIEDGIESLQVLMANELTETLSPREEETNNEVTPERMPDAEEHPTSLDSNSKPSSIGETVYPSP
uniref:Ring finger protein 133 n=1 Tax=Chinchilla lanigera TaxID=34839 RepID=A0A8C2W3Q4_CHILA